MIFFNVLFFNVLIHLVNWQLLSNGPAVRGLQKTLCQWVDLGLFN